MLNLLIKLFIGRFIGNCEGWLEDVTDHELTL